MKAALAAVLFLLLALAAGSADAQRVPVYVMTGVSFYQPKTELRERLGDSSAPFVDYVDQIDARLRQVFAEQPRDQGVSGAVVVALKPGRRARYWLAFGNRGVDTQLQSRILAVMEGIVPLAVQDTVAMAVHFDAWGGGAPVSSPQSPYVMPPEWEQALKTAGGGRLPDAVLSVLWPDAADQRPIPPAAAKNP